MHSYNFFLAHGLLFSKRPFATRLLDKMCIRDRGPVLKAKDSEMSVALGTIFILNAIALFIFPAIGHALNMDQQQFGTWAAIAIHDTSSVVGAGAAYGCLLYTSSRIRKMVLRQIWW